MRETMQNDAFIIKVLSTANTIGKILLTSGAETYRVEEAITLVCRRFDLKSESFVTMTCVLTSAKKKDGEVITEVNRIYSVSNNLNKIDRIHKILLDIHKYEIDDLEKEIKKLQIQTVYKKKVLLISYCFSAAFFSLLFDGKLKLNNFFINTLGGFLVTIFSSFATKLGIVSTPSYSAIGTLMLLVPGLALTNAIRDLINGDLLAGTSRSIEAALVGSALAIGTGFALFTMSYF